MSNIGYATLSVIPSARGFGSALSRDIDPQMHAPGLSAGKALGVGLLAGAAIVVAGIGAVIKTGVGEAMDASAGTAQLAAGIKSTGNAAGVSVDSLNALASSIQGYSGQTDDSIVQSEALLLTFTNIKNGVGEGSDIFDRATVATANMAARMGGDASSSAIQLGKALNDPVKGVASLTRMGVQFTAAQKDTIAALVESGDVMGAQKVILAELETQFGGAAAAAGESLPGKLAIAKRSFEDVSQSVAEGLLPLVLPGLTSIGTTITTKVIPAITGFIQGFKDGTGAGGIFRDVLDKIGSVLGAVGDVLSNVGSFITGTVIPGVNALVQAFKEGDVTSSGFAGVMERIGIGARMVADFFVSNVIPVIQQMAAFFMANILPAIQSIAGFVTGTLVPAIMSFYTTVAANVIPIAQALWTQFTTNILPALESVWAIIQEKVVPVLVKLGEFLVPIISFIYEWAVKIGGFLIPILVNFIGPILGGLISVLGTVIGWVFSAIGGIISFAGAIGDGITKVIEFASTVGTKINEVVGFFTGLPGKIGTAVSGMWDGITDSFKSALNTVIRAWNNFQITLGGGTTPWGAEWPSFTLDTPNIPLLAEGALVTGPALAGLGESGHEAVLPFSRVDEFAGMVARQMAAMDFGKPDGRQGAGNTFNVYEVADANGTALAIARRLSQGA